MRTLHCIRIMNLQVIDIPWGLSFGWDRVHHAGSLKMAVPERKIYPLKWERVPAMVPIHFFFFFTSDGKIVSQFLSMKVAMWCRQWKKPFLASPGLLFCKW